MIVICEECGKKYRIDPSKIKGDKARFKCRTCAHMITVSKPETVSLPPEMPEPEVSSPALPASPEKPPVAAEMEPEPESAAPLAAAAMERRKKKSGMGLTTKVILLMLLVSLVPGGIYFAISFQKNSTRIYQETDLFGKQVTSSLTSEVNEWIDKNVRVLKALAEMPAIQSMNRYEQEILLKKVQEQYPWMYLVFTTDAIGMNIARNDDGELRDYSDRQYVQEVAAGKPLAWQNLIGKTSKQPALVIAVPIHRGTEIVGVMAAAMTRDDISQRVANWKQGKTGFAFLVDENGKVVAHQQPALVEKQEDFSQNPLIASARNKKQDMIEFKDPATGNDTIGFARQTELGWVLATQQSKSEAFRTLAEAQRFALMLLGGTFVIVVLIAVLASRAIVNPIRKLTDAANRISVGELGVEIENKSKDEIGDLADAITRMQDSIRLSIERLRRRRR